MKNTDRSKRSRDSVLLAALTIIARDGAVKLTLDAIARESGISKGGLLHQCPSKEAVLKALVEYQLEHFDQISQDVLDAPPAPGAPEPDSKHLIAQLVTLRAVMEEPNTAAYAVVGALAEDPELLADVRAATNDKLNEIKAEASDTDAALLRWAAGRGLALGALFKMCPLTEAERARLFGLLFDDSYWRRLPQQSRKTDESSKTV